MRDARGADRTAGAAAPAVNVDGEIMDWCCAELLASIVRRLSPM